MNLFGFLLGAALLVHFFWTELKWRRHVKNWTRISGVVVDRDWNHRVSWPIIQYDRDGESLTITGERNNWEWPPIGHSVTVLYDAQTKTAVHYSSIGRWFGNIIVLIVGAMFFLGSLYSMLALRDA